MELKSDSEDKEADCLLHDTFPTVKKLDDSNNGSMQITSEKKQDGVAGKEQQIMEKETFDLSSPFTNYELKTRRKTKFGINKSMLTFRITQFLWYGGGSLQSLFLGIFIKQRGMSTIEISSAYSVIFLFQFLCCFVTGIITDKIGNAKPVLLTLMFLTFSILVTMSLTPNVNTFPCTLMENTFRNIDESEIEQNISSCYTDCSLSNKKHVLDEINNIKNSTRGNSSFLENPHLNIGTIKSICNFSNFLITNVSFQSTSDNCCNSCINKLKVDCVAVRKEYLVVVYAILVVAYYSVSNTTYRFMNFTAKVLASKNDSDFGKELALAKCGNILVMIIVAFVLNIDKSSGSKINFDPVIWFAAGIIFCAFIFISFTSVPILPPGKHLKKKAFSLMKDPDVLVFISLVFMAGNGFAFNYTFHLVFLETLNSPSIVVALHSVAMVSYGFLILLTTKWWLKKFGTNKLLVLCFLFYIINFAGCSYLQNPWWILVLDISIAFTYDLFWITVVVHCFNVAPVGFIATLNALAGSVHYGIGRSSGVFFGGMLINYLGIRLGYRIMAAIFFATAILYCIFMYFRHKSAAVDTTLKANGTAENKISKNTKLQDA